jgi:tRNA modification GTPase
MSGDDLSPVLDDLLRPVPEPRRLSRSRLRGSAEVGVKGDLPCLALFQPGPRSFTGQDVLELQVPGNPALLERVIRRLLEAMRAELGAGRLAEAGEFTRRAFTAGRLDLTRAEGIAATIGAVSDAELRAAELLRRGRLGSWATDLVDRLGHLLALVEAGIDFVDEEDVVPIGPAELESQLQEIEGELDGLMGRSRAWSELQGLPWIVLVGPPNAGKSTLYNRLLGRERAVTSELAGTTRDVLTEPLRIERPGGGAEGGADGGEARADGGESAEIMLEDIAGLDEPRRALDRAMQQQAREAIERAELILKLSPAGEAEDAAVPMPEGDAAVLRIGTKADRLDSAERDDAARGGDSGGISGGNTGGVDLWVSAVTGEGIEALQRRIAEKVGERAVGLAEQMLALQPRHREELTAAREAVHEARAMAGEQRHQRALEGTELIADRMRQGLDRLAALGGAMTPDDVIGKVFATFCIGK